MTTAGTTATARVGTPTVTMRTYFSRDHLVGARVQRDAARALEATTGLVGGAHRSAVMLSLLSVAGFLEAVAHEIVLDAKEKGASYPSLSGLTPAEVATLGIVPLPKVGGGFVIFNQVLNALSRQPFDEDAEPFQGMTTIFGARNAIIHPFPTDTAFDVDVGTHHKKPRATAERLRGYGFPLHPSVPAHHGNADWPDRLLSAGCAAWATATAESFALQFALRVGVAPWWSP